MRYFRFGLWSERAGLRRVPLNPILDAGRMLAASDALIDLIRGSLDEMPFPHLPLRTDWSKGIDRALVSDWIDWISPYLLALPGIDDSLRGRLEQEAVREPLLVDDLWRLYPRVLNQDLMARARVEARLLRANS